MNILRDYLVWSQGPNRILLIGPPGSSKTMFLILLRQHLKDSYFIDGGNTTKAGIIDYLFKNRAPYLLIDEVDKMSPVISLVFKYYAMIWDGIGGKTRVSWTSIVQQQ